MTDFNYTEERENIEQGNTEYTTHIYHLFIDAVRFREAALSQNSSSTGNYMSFKRSFMELFGITRFIIEENNSSLVIDITKWSILPMCYSIKNDIGIGNKQINVSRRGYTLLDKYIAALYAANLISIGG